MSTNDKFKIFESRAQLLLEFEADFDDSSATNQTIFTVQMQKEELKSLWEDAKRAYNDCLSEESNREEAKSLLRECRLVYITCAAQMGELSQTFVQQSHMASTQALPANISRMSEWCSNRPNLKLPPIDVGTFEGDYKSWPEFRDIFTTMVIEGSGLPAVQKLVLLRQCTKGEAHDIVMSSGLTNDDFDIVWSNLKDRYENKRILINSQLKILLSLQPIKFESSKEINRMQREINNCILALKMHGIKIETWDPIFVYLCSVKLPEGTLSLWEQSIKKKSDIPRWEQMNEFLSFRFQTLETVLDIHNVEHSTNTMESRTVQIKSLRSFPTKVAKRVCFACSQDHLLRFCPKFGAMAPRERYDFVKKNGLCIACFSGNHRQPQCLNFYKCSKCPPNTRGSKHNSMLHFDDQEPVATNAITIDPSFNDSEAAAVTPEGEIQSCFVTNQRQVLLGTAMVYIAYGGLTFTARALIDSGSQASFISERFQRRLNLSIEKTNVNVSGLNNAISGSVLRKGKVVLTSPYAKEFKIEVTVFVLPKLTGNLPSQTLDISEPLNIKPLADPHFAQSEQVDLLIGADIYPEILMPGHKKVLGTAVAQNTVFGWILTGPIQERTRESFTTCVSFCTEVRLDEQLEKFWKVEEVPEVSRMSPEDEYCEELYRTTTKRGEDNRYIVSLPFKPQYKKFKDLGASRERSLRQFLRNETSLLKSPQLKNTYDAVLSEYEFLGHMSRTTSPSDSCESYYLPHHAVFKPESTSTKVRVVFNASSKTSSGLSLNDLLYTGPTLQNDLMLLIVRWRFFKFVFNGDIEKMYRQIWLESSQTPFQRILFRNDSKNAVQDFELKTVTFGVNCAPYLAIRTLLQLASDVEDQWPLASKILKEMMYVDDALAGAHDIELAIKARNELREALSSAGFAMRKWTSNDVRILNGLPVEHLLRENFLEIDDLSSAKTLGVRWNAKSDQFYFEVTPIQVLDNFTKREVLSIIARLFDPAGWLGPIVIVAKILMQQIWCEKTGWDENLTTQSLTTWKQFLADYRWINQIKIPRWVGFSPHCQMEVHGFCDASEKAYGACVFVRITTESGIVVSHLVLAKSKVAPIKTISLPRLELCGAALLSDLIAIVKSDLKLKENGTEFYCWSDSTIVLAWLQKPPCSWTTFVANRVSKIVTKTGKDRWFHVSSQENPADLISRGVRPQDLANSKLWWEGPEWLCLSNERWANSQISVFDTMEEQRSKMVFSTQVRELEDILGRFSSYAKALRVMSYVFRFVYHQEFSESTSDKTRGHFVVVGQKRIFVQEFSKFEMEKTKQRLIAITQKHNYEEEYSAISQDLQLSSKSSLLNLNPFLDKDGVLRVGGRLSNASNMSFNERCPILLPYSSEFTRLFVQFIHDVSLHGGNQLMLRFVRSSFWIPRAKNMIKGVINRCKQCVIQRQMTRTQIMAPLPRARTEISRPFYTTGVDFAGPYDIRNYTGRACLITKGYVCLFVCFATKAIHVEAVSDLSTAAFMAAFARFVARRGCPNRMYSDNGTNFVGASRILKKEYKIFLQKSQKEISVGYNHIGLEWIFNPPGAPHMGGLWESGVKSLKHHLKRIAGSFKYTFEEFATLLARIEACLNSRPLSPMSESVDCIDVLTPGHFLIGGPLLCPPEPVIDEAPLSITNRWQRVKALNQRLCMKWKEEYLKELQKRNKWKRATENLKVGDMVVVKEDNLPPNEWRLGRILHVNEGIDQKVRVVEVRTARGIIMRPIVKLVLLPGN